MVLLSDHYISSTFLNILADPSNADFWIRVTDMSTPIPFKLPFNQNALFLMAPLLLVQLWCSLHTFFVFSGKILVLFNLLVLIFLYSTVFWSCYVYYLTVFLAFVNEGYIRSASLDVMVCPYTKISNLIFQYPLRNMTVPFITPVEPAFS